MIEHPSSPEQWHKRRRALTTSEQMRIEQLQDNLRGTQLNLMNEATIWARAIYPLLMLAEQPTVQAWAQVALQATYPTFVLEGVVDGVLGWAVSGKLQRPYLVVVEAKRGLEASDPQYQLYGQMLAASWLNYHGPQADRHSTQEIYGCYTITDSWTFVRGTVTMTEEKPTLTVETSPEYVQRFQAQTILETLRFVVEQGLL